MTEDLRAAYLDAAAAAAILAGQRIVVKAMADYQSSLRAAFRGLWSGQLDRMAFFQSVTSSVERYLTEAWHVGAAECGIRPEELTDVERANLQVLINESLGRISSVAEWIEANSRAEGGKLETIFSRADLWVGRWSQARLQAKTEACADQKLKWVLGNAEHCSSCLKLAGKVKRASFWQSRGIVPRVAGAPYLICRGYNCACDLVETDEPLSPGPLPSLP